MISGRFADGRPVLTGLLWVPHLDIRAEIQFTLDSSAAVTSVPASLLNLGASDFPLDDAIDWPIPGELAHALERRALLTFKDDGGRSVAQRIHLVIVDAGSYESRLGRDILNDWLMVYDQPGDSLLFEPLT